MTGTPDDLALGSFSNEPPWSLLGVDLKWRKDSTRIRSQQGELVPSLISPPVLPPIRRAATVIRRMGLGVAVWWLTERKGPSSQADISRRLRVASEHLGPTYIKLLQIISAGEGLFPAELVAEARKCRDQVPAVGYQEIVKIVEADFRLPLHKIFAEFEPAPLAAASIAQVHRAVLTTGESVVVKVQRPGINELVVKDLNVLAWLAPHLIGRIPVAALANPPALVELFAETIVEELDFRLEADNMLEVAGVFNKLGQEGFVVPRPHPDLVSRRVLVMEQLAGFDFDDVNAIKAAGIDTHSVVRTGMLGFLEGAFMHGIFHGDLHGGNLLVLADGRTGLLDFGITARLTEKERLAFLRTMTSAMTNDVHGQIEALRDLGALPPDTDINAVVKDLGLDGPPVDPTKMEPDEMVKELQRIIKALLGYGARMPKTLMLYVKNLIFLDGAIALLAPDLDMLEVVTDIATHFAGAHGASIATQLGQANIADRLDLDGVKAGFGIDPQEFEQLTYAQLQERRALIRKRLSGRKVQM